LRQTELDGFADRLMNEMSGGGASRAVLARALDRSEMFSAG
jgi:ABC-type Mn2+/Zn2+ transport system ATPase subunit